MKDILDALLDLNKVLMLDGYESDYKLLLSDFDFEHFAMAVIEQNRKNVLFFPAPDIKKMSHLKLAGPGCYFWVYRESGFQPVTKED